MIAVLNAEAMRAADALAIQQYGIPGEHLMEAAGASVVAEIQRRHLSARRVLVLCGKGNNGGDGFVIARRLGPGRAAAWLLGTRADVAGDAKGALARLEATGVRVREVPDADAFRRAAVGVCAPVSYELVVDAMLGTGASGAPRGAVAAAVASLSAVPRGRIVAVDMPTGISADDGSAAGAYVRAGTTVTFAAWKRGQLLGVGADAVGEVVVGDIGIPTGAIAAVSGRTWCATADDAGAAYGPRRADAHKGNFGHVLIVAGAVGRSGAAVLAARAALRAGVGLVTVATPEPIQGVVAASCAEAMTEALPVEGDGSLGASAVDRVRALAEERDAVAIGPGLGTEGSTPAAVREIVARSPRPLVVDADGLNAFAATYGGDARALAKRDVPLVLTPHPGEAARLLGVDTRALQSDRLAAARRLAASTRSVAVLKGHRTWTADPDGTAVVNPTGNAGMATAGCGDVLTGIVGALMARGSDARTAATAAVYVHGLAGERAARRVGDESLVAGDVVDCLSPALAALGAGAS